MTWPLMLIADKKEEEEKEKEGRVKGGKRGLALPSWASIARRLGDRPPRNRAQSMATRGKRGEKKKGGKGGKKGEPYLLIFTSYLVTAPLLWTGSWSGRPDAALAEEEGEWEGGGRGGEGKGKRKKLRNTPSPLLPSFLSRCGSLSAARRMRKRGD